MSTKKLRTKNIDDSYDLKDTTLGISGLTLTKYEDKNKKLKTGIKIPQINVEYDRKEKDQITKASLSNVEVLENGEKVDLITRGINTNKEKSQEIIKDDEKYFGAPLHTDLLNKEEREKLVEDFKKTIQLPVKIVDGINYNNTKQYTENGELVNKLGISISAEVRDMNIDVVIKTDENRKDYEEALSKTLNEKGEYTDESLLIVRELVERVLAEKGIEEEKILFTTSDREELKGSNAKTNGKNYIINLNNVDISNFDNIVELVQYEGQRFSYKDKLEDDVAVHQGVELVDNLGKTKISSESMILSKGNEFVENEDLEGYRNKIISIHGGARAKASDVDGPRSKYEKIENLKGVIKIELEFRYGIGAVQLYTDDGVKVIVDVKHKKGEPAIIWGHSLGADSVLEAFGYGYNEREKYSFPIWEDKKLTGKIIKPQRTNELNIVMPRISFIEKYIEETSKNSDKINLFVLEKDKGLAYIEDYGDRSYETLEKKIKSGEIKIPKNVNVIRLNPISEDKKIPLDYTIKNHAPALDKGNPMFEQIWKKYRESGSKYAK